MTNQQTQKNEFHRIPCGRCGGSGYYGPLHIEGGKCFDCAGKGRVLSSRGFRQQEAFRSALTLSVSELTIGMAITSGGFKRLTVAKIEPSPHTAKVTTNGVTREVEMVMITGKMGHRLEVAKAATVRRIPSPEERDALLAKVQEIQ